MPDRERQELALAMTIARKLIHAASNDDRWSLCLGEGRTDVFVLHEPNEPSGGRPSRIELSVFLAPGTNSPERLALLGLIGSLVERFPSDVAGSRSGPEPGAAGAKPSPGEENTTT